VAQENGSRSRRIGSSALGVLAAVALLLALVTGYAAQVLFDSDQFANHATAALDKPEVETEVGRRITDGVLKAQSDLIAVRPVIEGAASGVVGSAPFSALFRAGVRDVHRAIFSRDQNTITLTLADIGAVLNSVVQRLAPKGSIKIKGADTVPILDGHVPSFFAKAARLAHSTRITTLLLIAFAIVAGGAGFALSLDRRHYVSLFAITIVVGAVVLILAYQIGRSVVLGKVSEPGPKAAAGAIWDTFLQQLRTMLLIVAGAAVILLAALNSAFRPIGLEDRLAGAWRWATTTPQRPRARAVRALVLVAVGLFIVLDRDAAIDLAVLAVGLYVIYKGVEELLRLIAPPPETVPTAAQTAIRRRHRIALATAVAACAGVLAIGLTVAFNNSSEAAAIGKGCNGSAKLCDHPLADVALPAAHNAMSAADVPGFLFPNQDRGIPQQLDDGVRGLLIDAHYGFPASGGKVKTDLGNFTDSERRAYEKELGPEAFDAALRIRDRLVAGGNEGERQIYLCHRFCELGAIPLDETLDDIRNFVVQHPDQVLVIVVEDYVTPEDFVAAVNDSGLDAYVYKRSITSSTPTLGEMVSSGHRVVLMAEMQGGGAHWYRSGYDDVLQETPYHFEDVSKLTDPRKLAASCQPNRGSDDNPLFLLNNWIDTSPAPKPSNAQQVNEYRALLDRARKCERIRGQISNLVAVDFYGVGDLMRVVDKLNGVSPPDQGG
jgi:hypothetical protein